MIKVKKTKDGKISGSISGTADEVLPEFFFLLNNITIMCMHNCKDGQHEEFAAALKYEIDKTYMEAIETAKKMGDYKGQRND